MHIVQAKLGLLSFGFRMLVPSVMSTVIKAIYMRSAGFLYPVILVDNEMPPRP